MKSLSVPDALSSVVVQKAPQIWESYFSREDMALFVGGKQR